MSLTVGQQLGFSLIALIAVGLTAPAVADSSPLDPGPLSFDARVECQRAIEEVYWRHRIWPTVNPGPKPALDSVLSDSALRERVTTYLQKSAALEVFWQRPLTGEQLQAEMNRMVRNTRDPSRLRELFDALDNDPLLIAECLARPALVDRLTRDGYARDTRFHGTVREQAEAALVAHRERGNQMPDLGGVYSVTEWRLAAKNSESADLDTLRPDCTVIDLESEEWRERVGRFAAMFRRESGLEEAGAASALLEQIPLNRLSRLGETDDRFEVISVLSKASDRVEVATVAWRKQSFGAWWREVGRAAVQSSGRNYDVLPPPGGYELQSPVDSDCDADTWTALWYAPSPRVSQTAVWTGTEMIVWGGAKSPFYLNTGGRYNPATDSWTVTSTGAGVPTPRSKHTAVWTGTEMIIWGGRTDGSPWALNSGGRYDPLTDSWTATSTGAGVPAASTAHAAVWTGTEMIVWGGFDGTYMDSGGRYHPVTDSWTATSTGPGVPTGRTTHTAVWTGTEMIVWGGFDGTDRLNSGGRYDPQTDSWTATSLWTGVPAARDYHTAVWTGDAMIVWGGYDGTNLLNTGAKYYPAVDTWYATSTTGADLPERRRGHTAIWTGSEMIVWGGGGSQGWTLNSGSRYHPSGNSWVATSTNAGVPGGKSSHTAVWTGTEMIVWGGGGTGTNTGGRYDPATDSWTPTMTGYTINVPTPRYGHTSVWTGAEMIVWGGNGDFGRLETGGRYDPATDSWTPTSTGADAPGDRDLHTAVWTGTEMIVWGGRPAYGSGGRYDPVNDSWTPTSMGPGVPAALYDHTAVWTGTEMIIWGGRGSSSPYVLNSGGRYDPATDSWTATSTAGVPAARKYHTAVWTGAEMIVWGGSDDPNRLNTGGRYDPETDSWAATSTETGVPTVRTSHSAIWAGREMIVWGGTGDGFLDTGGRYDPEANNWTPTSTGTGVPSGRYSYTAVWTGTEMIVWGGRAGFDVRLNSGGLYDPVLDSWTATSMGTGLPDARSNHQAVWTGREMIVWGGDPPTQSGGLYCACSGGSVNDWYLDADGDGFGNGSMGIPSCVQPPGYIADGNDCDDADPDTHPGAPEINDGLDNQCPGDDGFGLVDEISGICGFHNAENENEFSWTSQVAATNYEVARSTNPLFVADCVVTGTTETNWIDTEPVPESACLYYLVRSVQPSIGSWGANSEGVERTSVCP